MRSRQDGRKKGDRMAKPTDEFRTMLLSLRQGWLIQIGAVETYLDLERTKIPNKHSKSTVYMRKEKDEQKNKQSS